MYSESARHMSPEDYVAAFGNYFKNRPQDAPEQKIEKWPAITAMIVGSLVLLSLGGLGVTGLLHSYEVIHLSPSWITSVIEAIGGAAPYGGLWAITGVGFLGGCAVGWGIDQMHRFNEARSTFTAYSSRRREFFSHFFKEMTADLLPLKVLVDKIAGSTPENCYSVMDLRGARHLFIVNDAKTFLYYVTGAMEGNNNYGETLLGLGFQYYDHLKKVRFPIT